MKPRVTLEELSRLLDGELPEAAGKDVQRRLAECPVSRALLSRMKGLTSSIAQAILTASPAQDTPATAECLNESLLMRMADNRISEDEKQRIEEHIMECERCIRMVLENLRTTASMHSGKWPALPPEVGESEQVRSLINTREREPDHEDPGRISFSLDQEKAVTHTFGSGHIAAKVILGRASGNRARVEFMFKERLQPKAAQEVVLTNAKTRRKIFTGISDTHGHLVIDRLPRGEYVAHFSDSDLKIEITIET